MSDNKKIAEEVFKFCDGNDWDSMCDYPKQENHASGYNDDDVVCRLCAIARTERALNEAEIRGMEKAAKFIEIEFKYMDGVSKGKYIAEAIREAARKEGGE